MGVLAIMGQRLSRIARAVGSRSGRLIRGRRSSRAGCRQRIALGRRFGLELAVGSSSGRLIRGRRSSRALGAGAPGASPWAGGSGSRAGCREQERQADQGSAIQPRRVPAGAGALPWAGGSGLGWLARAGAAG